MSVELSQQISETVGDGLRERLVVSAPQHLADARPLVVGGRRAALPVVTLLATVSRTSCHGCFRFRGMAAFRPLAGAEETKNAVGGSEIWGW